MTLRRRAWHTARRAAAACRLQSNRLTVLADEYLGKDGRTEKTGDYKTRTRTYTDIHRQVYAAVAGADTEAVRWKHVPRDSFPGGQQRLAVF